jgi:acyl dehydratase
MHVGQTASIKRAFSQGDFNRFAALSGDDNPIHVDPEFSARTKFGRTVAHGMLLYSAVGAALGTRLPGPGTIQLAQGLMFPSPTYAGEEVVIRLEVTQVRPEEGWAELTTGVVRPDGSLGLRGQTRVQPPGGTLVKALFTRLPVQRETRPNGLAFKGLEVGQRAATRRTFTPEDLAEYTELTGDTNPIFGSADFARRLGLEGPIVPGGLLGGLFSFLLGTRLPGQGTNYLKQRLAFAAPAYVNQELTATVEIVRIRPEKGLVNLRTVCTNPGGETVCQGEALVLVSDLGVV